MQEAIADAIVLLVNFFGLSEQQQAFRRTSRCPNGHFLLGTLRLTDSKGGSVGILTPYPLMDRGTTAQCPNCSSTWPVFDASLASPTTPSPWRITDIVETARHEEPIGQDTRLLDSSQTAATISRTLSFTMEWTQTLDVEIEKTKTIKGQVSISAFDIASLEGSVEQSVRNKYGLTTQEKQTQVETMSIPVPAGTRLRVSLTWKRVWQAGHVELERSSGEQLQVPFAVAVGLTFDQVIVDE